MSDTTGSPVGAQRRRPRSEAARRFYREVTAPGNVHPALIPGIGVESTGRQFSTNRLVFAIAAGFTVLFISWGLIDSDGMSRFAALAVQWVSTNFGWLFSALTLVVALFMAVLAIGPRGRIPLGADGEGPEFSTVSWIAMIFAAGMGIGLMFYGPYEPLVYFMDVPHGFAAASETRDAMLSSMAQTMFHWGPLAWSYYALVGGAIAYAAYRRGRSPLISAIFDPIFSERTRGPLGAVIDIFAIIVTLFGTAVSLGIGALQIGRGIEIVAGVGPVGNGVIIGIIAVLTAAFIISAVSGVKRGIRALSNINMILVAVIALFVFLAGPTLFLLNFIPTAAVSFIEELGTMLMRSSAEGADAAAFMDEWTTYYWAWWVSWTPFVGMFIAKISRGRTIRQFVAVVVLVPSAVCLVWFGIFGGTSMFMQESGSDLNGAESSQDILFAMLAELPLPLLISIVAMVAIMIFFVTSADSASIVMGSMSQHGQPVPSRWVTVTWGLALSGIAITLLLAGGSTALSGLQALVTVSALPFAIVVVGIMIAWWRDLTNDPVVIRRRYAREAIAEGVRRGIEEHGDDFVFEASATLPDEGAGAWLDSKDPALTEWYEEAVTGAIEIIRPEDTTPGEAAEAAAAVAEEAAVVAEEAAAVAEEAAATAAELADVADEAAVVAAELADVADHSAERAGEQGGEQTPPGADGRS